jgi:hypothetical protein
LFASLPLATAATQSCRQLSLGHLAFHVIAPAAQINAGVFGSVITKASIETKVRQRIAVYAGQYHA